MKEARRRQKSRGFSWVSSRQTSVITEGKCKIGLSKLRNSSSRPTLNLHSN
jgi:hypothetical protein